ncbi:MAG: RCC1 domain-containing protein, partial [Gammaproteobacteria bacterium]
HDGAPFDSRDHRDLDGDFIGDGNDLDRDGDTIHNDNERNKGSDPELYDTDRDGVNDGLDYYAHDKRYWNKNQYIGSDLFTLKQIGSLTNWKSISTWNSGQIGSSMAAINNLGELYVWGMNYGSLPFKASNQNLYSGLPLERVYKNWNLGISDAFVVQNPTKIRNEIKWKKISLGKGFGLGTDDEDKIYSWGINLSSQLGIGKPTTFVDFTSPKLYLGDIKMISAGDQQTGIINEDGKLRMIGSNDQGQLGTGASPFNYPRELDWTEISADIKKVRVTFTETQILDSQGYIWAYGDNDYGQLGRGLANTAAENFTVGKVLDVQGQEVSSNQWTDIYSYSQQAYAFKLEGNEENLYAWGNNENYALGIDKSKSEYPNQIPFESTPVKVENIVKSEILETDGELQFTPVNGGFIFIKKNVSPNP